MGRARSVAKPTSHQYTKVPLIPLGDFFERFPEQREQPESDIMCARLDHEYQERIELEEQRQDLLKQKDELVTQVKKGKQRREIMTQALEKFMKVSNRRIKYKLANYASAKQTADPIFDNLALD